MLFGRFAPTIEDSRLTGMLWGEAVNIEHHAPACEPKGATYTALRVARDASGIWSAACVVARFTRLEAPAWRIDPHGSMRVPAII